MNLEKIEWASRWADKFAAATKTFAEEIAKELARAQAMDDPLGVHIFQARAGYRRIMESDCNKSGRKTDHELRESYKVACTLGFKGSFPMWQLLMAYGKRADGDRTPGG